MKGHTGSDINARVPMSPGMVRLLRGLAKGKTQGHHFTQPEKAQARALMDRGFAQPDPAGWWEITPAGRHALEEL